jgi:IclR helix-turn-helix domain
MKVDVNETTPVVDAESRSYSAPALEKGLDILETLCRSEHPMSQKDIAQVLGRSVGEIYRMMACLVNRNYVTLVDENNYSITTKLFELSHVNPPTHRLLFEAAPVMQRLASELDQSCHLTVYGQGKQVVLCKVDTPSGMGFAVRAGAELDVLISASGRVLLAFQDEETRKLRIVAATPSRAGRSADRQHPGQDPGRRLRVDPQRAGARAVGGELPDPRYPGSGHRGADGAVRGTHGSDPTQVDSRGD